MFRITSLAVLLLAALAVSTAAQKDKDKPGKPPEGWATVTQKLSGCSAYLPGKPRKEATRISTVEVWLSSDKAVFNFSCRRDDDLVKKAAAEKALAEEGRLEAKFSNGVVANVKKLSVKGAIGKEFQILDKDTKKVKSSNRVYVVGKHVINLSANDEATDKDVKIFFDSFKLPALADDKAKVYKTPQEVFDAFVKADQKKDRKVMVACLAPQALKELAGQMAIQALSLRTEFSGEKNEEKRAVLVKFFKPASDAMDKHGLTAKATKDVKLGKTPKEQEAVIKTLLALVKNPEAFTEEIFVAFDKIGGPDEKKDDSPPKLTKVKIDGDKATGTVFSKDKKGKEKKESVSFVKVKGSWRIIPPMDGDEEPKDKKDETEKWTPSVELTSKSGKWLLKEAKTGTRMLADRTEYTLTTVPKEMAGGTLVVRNSPEYGSWLPDGSVKANKDATVYAILRVKYAGKEVFGELAQALLVKDGWKEVETSVATTEPRGEKWEWKAFKTTVKKGEIVLKLDNLVWRNNATGVLFVVK